MLLQHLDDALADDLDFLLGELLQNGKQQLLLSHGRGILYLDLFRNGQKFGGSLLLEILEFHLRHGQGISWLEMELRSKTPTPPQGIRIDDLFRKTRTGSDGGEPPQDKISKPVVWRRLPAK